MAAGYVLLAYVLPRPAAIQPASWHVFAVFVLTIVGMILQPLPPAAVVLIGMTMFVVLGGVPLEEALSGFAQPPVWMLLGAMLMARTLIDTGLSRRLALLCVRRFGQSSLSVVYALTLTDLSLGGAIPSITARSGGIILPIARSIGALYESSAGATAPLLGTFLMAALYQTSVVVGAMFLTGQGGNVLAASLAATVAGVPITWSSWLVSAILPGLISVALVPYVVYRLLPPIIKHTPAAPEFARAELKRMGPLTGSERVVLLVIVSMCVFWASGGWTGIHAALVALVGVTVLLVTNTLRWESALADRGAWDVFIWYGGLVMMGNTLNHTGVPGSFAMWVGSWFVNVAWFPVLIVVLLIYFYAHYGFATVTVHVLAMFPPFAAVLIGLGAPPKLAAYSLACLAALSPGLTHYGTTTAPLFIRDYVSVAAWWRVGFVVSVVNLGVWLTLGLLWWKVLGYW